MHASHKLPNADSANTALALAEDWPIVQWSRLYSACHVCP